MKNLATAFVGESMARNRYDFFSKIAEKEGYQQIAEIFLLTSENEKEHAETVWELLEGISQSKMSQVELETEAPIVFGNTTKNLESAIAGENHESEKMYPDFAKVAEEEGLLEVSARLRAIALAEKHHRDRFEKILEQIKQGTTFKKSEEREWTCRKCGYTHVGFEPPEKCPSCYHNQSYFQIKCEEY